MQFFSQKLAWNLLLVATGGAVGSVLRYIVSLLLPRLLPGPPIGIPLATATVNIVGSAAFGFIATAGVEQGWLNPQARLLLLTGLMGGFTTFSSYTWEAVESVGKGSSGVAVLLLFGQLILGFSACLAGVWLAQKGVRSLAG